MINPSIARRVGAATRLLESRDRVGEIGHGRFAFFLAELGDKTMLATITLAPQRGWFGTWIGSTVGMGGGGRPRHPGRPAPRPALFSVFGAWLIVDAAGRLAGA